MPKTKTTKAKTTKPAKEKVVKEEKVKKEPVKKAAPKKNPVKTDVEIVKAEKLEPKVHKEVAGKIKKFINGEFPPKLAKLLTENLDSTIYNAVDDLLLCNEKAAASYLGVRSIKFNEDDNTFIIIK